jgi:formate-dependent nitrite reductase membrane component NrfD
MKKLLLLSVVIAMMCVPILAARDRSPGRALKKTLLIIVIFNLVYLLLLRFVYPYLE